MNKKILKGVGGALALVLPLIALAQVPTQTASNCCMLKHEIAGYEKDECVCEPDPDDPTNLCSNDDRCISKGVELTDCTSENPDVDWGGVCTMDTVYTVTDWIFWIFLAFVIIMGVITGFMFMTAGGDPGKVEKARGMIVYLVIGIVVAVIVKVIPALARSIVGL
jgi:hypothetical protein